MPVGLSLLERAYELARSGSCKDVKDIRRRLKGDGFTNIEIDAHLHGRAITTELIGLIRKARATAEERSVPP